MGECQGGTWKIPAACYEGETLKPGNFYIADHFNSGSALFRDDDHDQRRRPTWDRSVLQVY